jgi:uncharacterized repeat protein (TIGR02543 family)
MFNMCASIYNGENDWYCLPAEELAPHCYDGMFGTYRNNYYRTFKSLEIMATSLQDRCGNDIENCMRRMLNYNPMNQNAGQFGRGALNVRMYWIDWGNTDVTTAPTYGWFSGFLYSNCTFNYQKGLTPLTKVAKTNYSNTTMSSLFPYSCTLKENEFTYLTFDCKTNGGTWEEGCTYDADLRRVVRSDYKAKTVPADPVKAGATFKGWFTAPTGGTKVEKATILNQTTAQTYYAQFGDGGDDGGEGDDQMSYTLNLSTGVLDFPQYTTYSYTSKFAVIGETDNMTIRLQFNGNILQAVSDYKDFATALSAADSYVELKDGTRRTINYAQKASLLYYGDLLRAAHLIATVYDEEDRTYNIEIYTNELLNYATFEEDYRYKYYSSTLPIESGWVNGRKFQYNETNHMPSDEYHAELNETYKYWRYFYGMSSPFDYCQILINFVVDESKTGIPTGYYPINSTLKPGTVFIGSIPCGDNAEIARSNNKNYACGGNTSWLMHYYENEYGIPIKDNWLLRGGYVQIVNKDGNYYMHVHAITDATRTNGESSNNVIDFTAGDESLADQLPGPDDNPGNDGGDGGNGGDDGDDPETPIESQDASVYIYQGATADTIRILYNLDPKEGSDGLTYQPVDLGYGVAWADRNVGATNNKDAGTYFYWGGTTAGKGGWMGYFYDTYTKHTPADYILKSDEDAATVNMGSNWHTPNYNEWEELVKKTNIYNNVISSRPYNFNNITLPAAGYYNQGQLCGYGICYYWSSQLAAPATNSYQKYDSYGWVFSNEEASLNNNFVLTAYYMYAWNDAPIRAIYEPSYPTYRLTIRSGDASYIYICQGKQKVTVTAIATKKGSEFLRWEEDGNTDAVRTFVVTKDVTYTAIFSESDEPETPETPEIPETSPEAFVDVYQFASADTMKIVYDLSPRQGNDGLWYTPVDMGYGVAWADRNVGASSVGSLGGYFRWGDPLAGTDFSENHARNLNVSGYQKYDDLTPAQDAATVNMGSEWRMPDEEDFYQLKTKSLITENRRFANKYYSSSYIILPAGGYKGSTLYDADYQYYWSRQFAQYGNNSCSGNYGYSTAEYTSFALVRTGYNEYYVQNKDKDDCMGNETYLGMQVRGMFVPPFQTYRLTISVEGKAKYVYVCQAGQKVTVTAHAAKSYKFDKWVEDGNQDGTRTFTVNSDMLYTATFTTDEPDEPEDPEEPETPEMSPDAAVNVYQQLQSVTPDTMRILYDLSPRQGKDGNIYTPVDMGYGVAWADRNVGATATTEVGGYFYWGGTVAKTSFSSSQYFADNHPDGYTLTAANDAATQNMGTAWRMPTDDEWVELKNTAVLGTDNGTFTNPFYKDRSISLPAGGLYGGTSHILYSNDILTLKITTPALRSTQYRFYWSSVLFRTKHDQTGDDLYMPWTLNSAPSGYQVGISGYNDDPKYDARADKMDYVMDYYGLPVRAIYNPAFKTCRLTIHMEDKANYVYVCQAGQKITVTAHAEKGYEFDKWLDANNNAVSSNVTETFTVNGDMGYTAMFKRSVQTAIVIFRDENGGELCNDEWEYGQTPSCDLPQKNDDGQYTYTYSWDKAIVPVNGPAEYKAVLTQTKKQYTLTWNMNGGVTTSTESDYTHGTVEWGVAIIRPADPTRDGFDFVGWRDQKGGDIVADEMPAYPLTYTAQWKEQEAQTATVRFLNWDGTELQKETLEYGVMPEYKGAKPSRPADESGEYEFAGWTPTVVTVSGDADYTASYRNASITDFDLVDDKMEGDAWYGTLTALKGQTLNVRYVRTLSAGQWQVLSLPFDFNLLKNRDHPFSGHIYYLDAVRCDEEGYLMLNFLPVSVLMKANTPYVYYSDEQTVNPVFESVTLAASEENSYAVDACNGTVTFINTLFKQRLEANARNLAYIQNNRVYHPGSSAVWMRAFRGVFRLDGMPEGIMPRMRLMLNGETATAIEQADMPEEDSAPSVRKYMQNGVLVIEIGNIRYNAQGARIR